MSDAMETKRRPATDDQQARASDPTASVWVSANAGSGKTHALTTRVTRLLLAGTEPERILCLTYTKAAAAEMSSRLYQRLGAWAMEEDDVLAQEIAHIEGPMPDKAKLTRARRLFARAIETPGGLKIQTIHAFCQSLLGRFPLEAQVPPNFRVLDDRGAAELLEEVRNDVLEQAREDEDDAPLGHALDYIVSRIDETAFARLMKEIAGKRAAIGRLVAGLGGADEIADAIRMVLEVRPGETQESAEGFLFDKETFPDGAMKAAIKALQTGTKTDQARAEELASILATPKTKRGAHHDAYVSIFLTQKDEPRKSLMTKKPSEAFPIEAEALYDEQMRVVSHLRYLKSVQVAEASEAILRVALEILDGFAGAKRRHAFLDYEDMISKTREMLLTGTMAPWVLYKLDGGIDHILVDEAQDTSPDQWDVIAQLTAEFLSGAGARELTRTLFAVGDEKQSIYSFQGADPKRFDEMRVHFEHRVKAVEQKWDPVSLVRSFRSTPQVLQAVDAVFARAEASEGLTASGVIDMHMPVREGDAGLVELWDLEKPDEADEDKPWDAPLNYVNEDDPRAKLARRIADTISGWMENGEELVAKGRPIRPGDILILVRRRDAFVNEIVRLLKQAKVPVAGADRMVVTDEIAVMDLMALGEFTLLPEDDLNLAIVLKSPLVGLSEEELYALAHDRGRASLWSALQKRAHETPAFEEAHALLERLLKRADFEPPFEFFAHVLGEERGRQKLLARLGPDANDPIDEFLNLALDFERDHAASMQGFLHWIVGGGAEIKRDMDKGRDEVRIMTVHGAKGLEAEVVFMPDTCSAPGARHDPALISLPTEPALLVWPVRKSNEDEMTGEARLALRQGQAEEYRRLLYVAMTRARDRLYVCGYQGKNDPAPECWYNLIAAALKPISEEVTDAEGRTLWRMAGTQTAPVKKDEAEKAAAAQVQALPGWAREEATAEPSPSRPLAPSRLPPDGSEEPAAASPLAGDRKARFKRGTLIHRLLQSLPDLPADAREEAALRMLASPALELDEAAKAEIIAATLGVLNEPQFAEIFGPGSRAEAALVGQITFAGKPVLVSGQIDRLCVTPTRVLVIDYKTNRPAPPRLEDVQPAYFAQMAAYRAVLGDIYPDREIICALLWTDGPRLMELPAERLQSALSGRATRP
ncbi:MAG: double-strand break repair helicase AddA [Parvibaculum sp.]